MKKRVYALVLMSTITGLSAQEAKSATIVQKPAVQSKIAFVDMAKIQRGAEELQDMIRDLYKEVEKRYVDISKQKEDVQRQYQEASSNRGKNKFESPEVREARRKDLAKRQSDITIEERDLQMYHQRMEDDIRAKMSGKIQQAAEKTAKESGWDAVEIVSLYVSERVDITDQVIDAMNKEYATRKPKAEEKKTDVAPAAAA